MNTNTTPDAIEPLVALVTRAEIGALNLAVSVGLKQNTAAAITADKEALIGKANASVPPDPEAPIGAQAEYVQARAHASDARVAARLAIEAGREFCRSATDVLRKPLGRRWNPKWMAAGFTGGSLALPRNPVPPLGLFRAYFREHPEHANVPLAVTEAGAQAALTAITTAQAASDNLARVEADAKVTRDVCLQQLRRRMISLRTELSLLLSADDPRWYEFGFNRPSDGRLADPVAHLGAQPAGPGQLHVTWDRSRLATNYRVTRLIRNVDTEPVEVGLFADPDATITGLPAGSTVIIGVSAHNSAGDTQPTQITVNLP